MADIVDKETRSKWMAGIGTKNTRPELTVRKFLHREGFRYVLNDRRLPGSPDVVLPKYKVCIFVHGCFWHRHPGCASASLPSTRTDFWQLKFAANMARDQRNVDELIALGWTVVVLWECGLKRKKSVDYLYWLPTVIRKAQDAGPREKISWPSPTRHSPEPLGECLSCQRIS